MDKTEFFRDARSDLAGPLTGLRVLEATTTWAGPLCGCVLADLGAEVIKVEIPCGEVARHVPPLLPGRDAPLSFMHVTVNRNKRSLTLDLREAPAQRIFRELVRRVDLVVENFRPGRMSSWGLGYAELRALRPDLVYVSISGFGQWGPGHDRVAYDPVAQAESGWVSLNGEPDGEPAKSPTFLADDLAGMHAAVAALAAIRHRDRTGEGQHVDVSLLDALLFQSNGFLTLAAMDVPLQRMGGQFLIAAPAGVYRCRDGHVLAGVLLDAHWRRLVRLIGRPELADDPGWAEASARVGRRDEANALLADWLAPLTASDAAERLTGEGLPAAVVRSYAEAAADPHVRARDMLQPIEQENGHVVPITGPAAKLSRTPTCVRTAAPALGAHTDEILEELGLSGEQIAELRADGIV
ncbi:MAG: CaiB/BaiF CoA transferase family protein [Myxococcota bacterium]